MRGKRPPGLVEGGGFKTSPLTTHARFVGLWPSLGPEKKDPHPPQPSEVDVPPAGGGKEGVAGLAASIATRHSTDKPLWHWTGTGRHRALKHCALAVV